MHGLLLYLGLVFPVDTHDQCVPTMRGTHDMSTWIDIVSTMRGTHDVTTWIDIVSTMRGTHDVSTWLDVVSTMRGTHDVSTWKSYKLYIIIILKGRHFCQIK